MAESKPLARLSYVLLTPSPDYFKFARYHPKLRHQLKESLFEFTELGNGKTRLVSVPFRRTAAKNTSAKERF